jgi:hypothetical protein
MVQLKFCEKCNEKKFTAKQGIVCGITDEKPAFEYTCPYFSGTELHTEVKEPELRRNDKRAKTLHFTILSVVAIHVIYLVFLGLQYNIVQAIMNGEIVSNENIIANDFRVFFISWSGVLGSAIFMIVFIFWFRRAYYNLHLLAKNLTYSEGWAAGSWFIPVINAYRPYYIMKDLYVETKKILNKKYGTDSLTLSANYIRFWWILWIINGVFSQVLSRFSNKADTLQMISVFTVLLIISSFVNICHYFLTLRIVKDYSEAEKKLIEHCPQLP